jgi:large subunit ribosomal protein L5
MKITNTRVKYEKEAVAKLKEGFGYSNVFSVPKIEKVIVNVGIGRLEKEKEKVKDIVETIRVITGQNPTMTKARKSISGFKVREGSDVGVKVVLRGKNMWHFLDKLINIAYPRTRDFQGVKISSVSSEGDLNLGIKEQIVFPEITPEEVRSIFSLQVNVKTTAKNKEEGEALFRALGVPLKEKN